MRDAQGRLPIHYAAMHEDGDVADAAIRLLAKAPGFAPNARRSKAEQGTTALHTAALRRTDGGRATTAIIEALLDAGAGGWAALPCRAGVQPPCANKHSCRWRTFNRLSAQSLWPTRCLKRICHIVYQSISINNLSPFPADVNALNDQGCEPMKWSTAGI